MTQAGTPTSSSSQAAINASGTAAKGGAPFFLINAARVAEIAKHQVQDGLKVQPLAHDEMQAYIAQWAGVDSDLSEFGRISTHGAKALSKRTELSIRHAKHALGNLVQAGFLVPANGIQHPSLPPLVDTTHKVDPQHEPDLAIAQSFLAEKLDDRREKLGSLRHLVLHAEGAAGIWKSTAVMDAIHLFLSLHMAQDFERYAGVDPQLVGTCCERLPWQIGTLAESRAIVLSEFQGLAVEVAKKVQPNPGFVKEVMSYWPSDDDMAPEQERFNQALKNLKNSDLVYDAYVLWEGDPTKVSLRHQPSVISTLHVSTPQDRRLEDQLESDLEKIVGQLQPHLNVGYIGHSAKALDPDPGHFRTIVQTHLASTACIVKQLRVRHWAHDANNLGALEVDAQRVQREVSKFHVIKNRLRERLGLV